MKRASALSGRLSIVLLLLYSVVFFPRVSEAGPVGVEFYHPFSYGDLEFGPDVGFAQIADGGLLSGYPEARLSGPNGSFEIVEGTINLVSGPLLDVTPSSFDAIYTHAAGGSVSFDFDLLLPNASLHHGTFTAPLGSFIIYADADGGGGHTDGDLGPGLFDDGTATLLGIKPRTLFSPGGAWLWLDSYDSYPSSHRVAQSFGSTEVIATTPEPATGLLLVVGGIAGALRFRRRHQISASTQSTGAHSN